MQTRLPNSLFFESLLVLTLLGLVLAGCAGFESPPQAFAMATPMTETPSPVVPTLRPTATAVVFALKPTGTPLPTRTPAAALNLTYGYGPADFPPGYNPLTGLPVADPGLLERRPVAIKVTNFPRSVRPQWGLSLADHVFDYYIGDQMTRFIGVFYGSDANQVGPVRSGRFFDEHVIRMYKSILVFGMADSRVLDPWLESDIRSYLVVERPDNCPPLCRIGPESAYNTLFADTQQLGEYLEKRGTNNDRQILSGLRFESAIPFSTLAGNRLSTFYTWIAYNLWEYNAYSGRYLRFQEAQDEKQGEKGYQPLVDSLTHEQITADNVVVLLIPHEYYVNTETTEMVTMNFFGQGVAYAFRDGKAYQILWRRDKPEMLLSLEYPGGQPYSLKPGNTWFQVIGASSAIQQGADGAWDFKFAIP